MQKIDFKEVKELSRNQWEFILTSLGIPANVLINRHQPCPACGGKDRFRFDNSNGSGSFICTGYKNGGGAGFGLVMHYLDCDYRTAVKTVAGILGVGNGNYTPVKRINKPEPVVAEQKDDLEKLQYIWSKSKLLASGDFATEYLTRRGLDISKLNTDSIRCHFGLKYWFMNAHGQFVCAGVFPALVSAICSVDGQLQGLHITYIDPKTGLKLKLTDPIDGKQLPAKKMRSRFQGSLKGCAIHIHQVTDRLAVSEGIENALASFELNEWPVWACGSAGAVKNLVLPNGIKELFIIADNDQHGVGMNAAEALAKRATLQGVTSYIWSPEEIDTDALDVLKQWKEQQHV